MGFWDKLFNRTDINIAVEQFQATPGAFLIDVRTGPEYEAGHIEGAVNVPLNSIHFIVNHVRDITAPPALCILPERRPLRPGCLHDPGDGLQECDKYRRCEPL